MLPLLPVPLLLPVALVLAWLIWLPRRAGEARRWQIGSTVLLAVLVIALLAGVGLGVLLVPSHALAVGLGLLGAAAWSLRRARSLPALGPRSLLLALVAALLSGVVGARLWYLAEFRSELPAAAWSDPLPLAGGLVFYGAVLVGALALVVVLRLRRQPVLATLDLLLAPACLALASGRLGCLLNGCCFGRPADLPWTWRQDRAWLAVQQDGSIHWHEAPAYLMWHLGHTHHGVADPTWCLARHPTQLYELLVALALLLLGLWTWRSAVFRTRPGAASALLLALYGLWRWINEGLRGDNPTLWWDWSASRWLSLLLVLAGVVVLALAWRRREGTDEPSAP